MSKQKENQELPKVNSKLLTLEERRAKGKLLRDKAPRENHAHWTLKPNRVQGIDILKQSNIGRVNELIPLRHGRMSKSPFTFYRGSAALMAADLAITPVSGIEAQLCGDCHLMNFGAYATPERHMIVDINDFDETMPGPWEWDLKRLAASFVLACRDNNFKNSVSRETVEVLVKSYRTHMRKFSEMRVLDIWYSKMTLETWLSFIKDKKYLDTAVAYAKKQASKGTIHHVFPKMTAIENGRPRFIDNPPVFHHPVNQPEGQFLVCTEESIQEYKETLVEDRRILLDRFKLMDSAIRVVGVGSVGTYCGILLFEAAENDPLILQFKEARASVLEPYLKNKSIYKNQGQRVVAGQRLMQAQSDIFIGWTTSRPKGRDFYLRQLKDMKMAITPEIWEQERAFEVAQSFGWVLARAHARSGDSAMISGYLGNNDSFDKAIAQFALAYADQTELDYEVFMKAVKAGDLEVLMEKTN